MTKLAGALVAILLLAMSGPVVAAGKTVLFIGNSFLFGSGSAVRFYRADTVTDLNKEGIGGVPALFKSFTQQAGLDYEVSLETRGGSGLDFHLAEKLGVIGSRPFDTVVMHGFSLLDAQKPRDPAKLVATSKQMADFLRGKNPNVELFLISTWARADHVYPAKGAWTGQTVEAMTRDVRDAYDQAANNAAVKGVIPVGESWLRAMQSGVADDNPYDGIAAGKLNLWTYDSYHASAHGYYLQALVIFGTLTGLDPRSLGDGECSAGELGFSRAEVRSLQQVAFDQIASSIKTPTPSNTTQKPAPTRRCVVGLHAEAQAAGDEAALRARIAAHERASAANDLRGLTDVYSLDAEMISASGAITKGRDAIEDFYRRQIASAPAQSGRHHTHPVDGIRIRLVAPDVALIDLPSRSVGGRGADGQSMAPSEITLITVWRKIGNEWLVVSQRALPAPPRTPPA